MSLLLRPKEVLQSHDDSHVTSSSLPSNDSGERSGRKPTSTLVPACNIVTPVGMLGYGLHVDQTAAALTKKLRNGALTAIILDSGSTDSGPEKLALGCMSLPRESYFRDLEKLIRLAWQYRVPLIFSSAGGDGSDEHVREMTDVVREICDGENTA
jgi:hypothetical protein